MTPRRSLKLFPETIQSNSPDKNVKNPETLTENSNENLVSPLSYTSFKIISRFTGFSRQNEGSECPAKERKETGKEKLKKRDGERMGKVNSRGEAESSDENLPSVSICRDELRKL